MNINTLNENIFKNHNSYYMLVDEDDTGLLGFVARPKYSTNPSDSFLEYETTYDVAQAYVILSGDPLLEVVELLAPYLSLYKVNPTYEFEYIDSWIEVGGTQ